MRKLVLFLLILCNTALAYTPDHNKWINFYNTPKVKYYASMQCPLLYSPGNNYKSYSLTSDVMTVSANGTHRITTYQVHVDTTEAVKKYDIKELSYSVYDNNDILTAKKMLPIIGWRQFTKDKNSLDYRIFIIFGEIFYAHHKQ